MRLFFRLRRRLCALLPFHDDVGPLHPAAAAIIDRHGGAGDHPGHHIAQAQHQQGVEPLEQGQDPEDAQQADAKADDHMIHPHSYFEKGNRVLGDDATNQFL